jgi:hypothetical protein
MGEKDMMTLADQFCEMSACVMDVGELFLCRSFFFVFQNRISSQGDHDLLPHTHS